MMIPDMSDSIDMKTWRTEDVSLCLSSLKVQQGLLVDFAAFPQKFIDLLKLCYSEQDSDSPR